MNMNFGKISYLFLGFFLLVGVRLYGQDTPPYGTMPVAGANGLYIFSYDEPEKLNRPEAVCACQNKGDGWRLPTLNELQVIASQNAGLTEGKIYWTMDKVVGKLDFYAVTSDGKVKKCAFSNKNTIRCVWSSYVAAQKTKPVEAVSEPAAKPVTEQSSKVSEKNEVAETTPTPKAKEEQQKENTTTFSETFPYKHSLGLIAGNINGISYKTFIKDHFAIELDLAGFEVSRGVPLPWYHPAYYAAPILNLNFLYQGAFTQGLYGIVGGGINLGYEWTMAGKIGAGALLGLEYVFEKPVALQFDFRPGYGCILYGDYDWFDTHFFDWALCLSVRYVLK